MKSNITEREFAEAAREYCSYIEELSPTSKVSLKRLIFLLSRLSITASILKEQECDEDSIAVPNKTPEIALEEYQKFVLNLSCLPSGPFNKIFNPLDLAVGPVTITLQDELSDIYLDIKDGLYFYDKGQTDAAGFKWWLGYYSHWGNHLYSAQRILFALISEDEI